MAALLRYARPSSNRSSRPRRAAAETAREAAEELAERFAERHGLVERARAEAEQAKAETTDVRTAVERLREAIAGRARSATSARERRRFARSPEALDQYRDELRRHADEIPPLKRQAEALRDAIYSELPYFLRAGPKQEILPVPSPDDRVPTSDEVFDAPTQPHIPVVGARTRPRERGVHGDMTTIEELTGRKVLAFMSAHNMDFEIFVLGPDERGS
jgi:hypothetical protein